jgi:hypothetical protein
MGADPPMLASELEIAVLREVIQGQPARPADTAGDGVQGARFLPVAHFHRLLPGALEVCERLAVTHPRAVSGLGILRGERDRLLSQTSRLLDAVEPAIAALAAEMPVMLAKGVQLSGFAPPPGPARIMADVDVYVPPDRIDDAVAICAELGIVPSVEGERREFYRHYRGQFAMFDARGTPSIDLHWWLNNSPLHRRASRFDLTTVLASSEATRWRGIPVRFPTPADALLLNAVYMLYENWFQRLRMFQDHRTILARVDLGRARARAAEVGLSRALEASLWLTEQVIGASLGATDPALPTDPSSGPGAAPRRAARARIGPPSAWTRLAHWAVDHRISAARFVVRAVECARIYDVTDPRFQAALHDALLVPDRTLRTELYLLDAPAATALLHPLALLVGLLAPAPPFGSRARRRRPPAGRNPGAEPT